MAPKPTMTTTSVDKERKVNTVKPTTVCDYAVLVKNGKVTCNPDVGALDLPAGGGDLKGFIGPMEVLRYEQLIRINWDELSAHVLIINDTKWAFVDEPGPNTERKTPNALATLLNKSDWGSVNKLVACGWGM